MSVLRARGNPRLRRWRALASDARARRREQRTLIEGARLVADYLDRVGEPAALLVSESGAQDGGIVALSRRGSRPPVVLADALFRLVSELDTPAGIAAEIEVPSTKLELSASGVCVLLDSVQDSGNLGAILRSAAAFGVRDVVLGPGCADPWSPKVLRAAMGGHFLLRIGEAADLAGALTRFGGMSVCTVARGGLAPADADLRGRIALVLGAEGRGVGETLAARCALRLTIPMPGRTESLNVAAAAAILFYERARQLSTGGARSSAPA